MHTAIRAIQEQGRRRSKVLALRIKLTNALGAYARLLLGFQTLDPEADRAKLKKSAQSLVKAMLSGESLEEWPAEVVAELAEHYLLFRETLDAITAKVKDHNKTMTLLAESLPVYGWVETIHGFGPLGLSLIIAECGDLSAYSNPGKLWKRLGLAPPDAYMTDRTAAGGGVACEKPKRRRSVMWTIGDSLLKKQNPYKELYLSRKEYETPRVKTKMHAHRRAQRYAEKRLLRDLWEQWRPVPTASTPSRA